MQNKCKIMSDVRSLFCFDVMCSGRTLNQFAATNGASVRSISVSCSKEGLTRVLGKFQSMRIRYFRNRISLLISS